MKGLITAEELRSRLHYSPLAGVFEWKKGGRRIRKGFLAGACCRRSGYVVICIDGTSYRAHRLAWLYMTGSWPSKDLDHIDGDTSNNAFSNLREATDSQQCWNQRISANNRSGVKGVVWRPDVSKWTARIRANRKTYWLGYFENMQQAESAVRKKRAELHGEFTNHGTHGYVLEDQKSSA